MDAARARELLACLADGVDPFTGELFPKDHICNQPEIIRAIHHALSQLSQAHRADGPPNAGKPWTKAEQDRLREEFGAGMKVSAIAREHGRSRGSIEAKLAHLGLTEDSYFTRRSGGGFTEKQG